MSNDLTPIPSDDIGFFITASQVSAYPQIIGRGRVEGVEYTISAPSILRSDPPQVSKFYVIIAGGKKIEIEKFIEYTIPSENIFGCTVYWYGAMKFYDDRYLGVFLKVRHSDVVRFTPKMADIWGWFDSAQSTLDYVTELIDGYYGRPR